MPEFPDEARRQIHEKKIGPRALARAAGVSTSTAAAWVTGEKRPAPERRPALESLGIPRAAWERAPLAEVPRAMPPEPNEPPPLAPLPLDLRAYARWREAIERAAPPERRAELLAQIDDLIARAPGLDDEELRTLAYALNRACSDRVHALLTTLNREALATERA